MNVLRRRCVDLAGEDSLILADGYDAALIGVCWREGIPIAVYDRQGVIDILYQRDGMTPEEASEFFDFNVQDAWLGSGTPLFMTLVR